MSYSICSRPELRSSSSANFLIHHKLGTVLHIKRKVCDSTTAPGGHFKAERHLCSLHLFNGHRTRALPPMRMPFPLCAPLRDLWLITGNDKDEFTKILCAEKFLLSPGQLIVLDVDGLGHSYSQDWAERDSIQRQCWWATKKVLGVAN